MNAPAPLSFRRVAILNRGEAAVRFVRALREVNAERGEEAVCVGFATTPDAGALFTRIVDEVVDVGPPFRETADGVVSAYRDADHIVALLRRSGCDAVWPGWGFASEDASFVARLEAEGIAFIGPPASAMELLGDKIRSRQCASEAGLPLAPWAEVSTDDVDGALRAAEGIGYPLMVKASAGGGGRGIRKVTGPDALAEALTSAQREAVRSFGDARLYLESRVDAARHVEVQFVVDAQGVATALGVRDCTVQRRHQKLIEETPAPFLPAEVAQQLCDGTARMAAATGYRGLGTAEFLYRPSDGLAAFIEVNARLQVEHTITEAVTNDDLVRAQIFIARGLPWEPSSAPFGHAIEVRVNAEDPTQGFRPAPGRVRVFRASSGPGVRVDTGVGEGSSIPAEFDSNIAKVIVHAPDRPRAIARMRRVLADLDVVIEGGATNKAFLRELLAQPPFVDGSADTGWLDRDAPALATVDVETDAAALVGAALLAFEAETDRAVSGFLLQAQNGVPQNLPAPNGRLINLGLRGESIALHVFCVGPSAYEIGAPNGTHRARFERSGPHSALLVLNGVRKRLLFAVTDTVVTVEVDGTLQAVELAAGGAVTAPAPAMVVDIRVEDGQSVAKGQLLAMLEAMKMELPVVAPSAGVIRRVRCREAEQVKPGNVLFELETGDASSTSGALRLPPPPYSPVDMVFQSGLPEPGLLDDAPVEVVDAAVSSIVDTLRAVMLGYDVSQQTAERIEHVFGTRLEFSGLRSVERWAPLLALLDVFADTEELFRRSLVDGDGVELSAQLAYYEYCRLHEQGEEGAQPFVRPAVRRALAHFGIDDWVPTGELRRALYRLSVGHAHGELRHRLCSALLRMVIGLADSDATPIHGMTELATTLSRVVEVATDDHPYVADNARQALYVLYRQPLYVANQRDLHATHQWFSLADDDDPAATAEYYAALGATPQTVLPHLFRIAADGADDAATLSAMVRRIYGPYAEPIPTAVDVGGVLASVGHMCGVAWLVDAAMFDAGLLRAAARVGGRVDVFCIGGAPTTWLEGEPADVFVLFLDGERIALRDAAGIAPPLGVHPAVAERLELDRLSAFKLTRIDTPERVVAMQATARENPRDERIFVRAEVFGATDEGDDDGEDWPRWEFEKVYYAGLRLIREAQSTRGRRSRFYRNRLTIYVHTDVAVDADRVRDIANSLEAPTRRLGLEFVNVRTRVAMDDGTVRPVEFVISKPGRHRLDVRTRAPQRTPIAPLTAYEQRVVRARRMGLVYPYEIIGMLEGKATEADDASFLAEAGQFVEHDLDETGTRLVPVDRPYGENSAGMIVGRIRNVTAAHPDGMERVFVANDNTRSLGSLAEPECRRVLAALDLAEAERLPIEWIATSSGARIAMDSGTENLDWTARVLRRIVEFTQAGGEIHIIVCGVNVGAQAYWNGEATMMMHTRGALIMTEDSAMVLTGKRALEYSGSVSAEDEKGIGGPDRVMGPNGQAQYVARDLGHAYAILFEYYRFAYLPPDARAPRRLATDDAPSRSIMDAPYRGAVGEFNTVGEIFSDDTNPGRKKPFAMREVMRAVIDADGGHLERWRPFRPAEMVIVWDAAIGGVPASVIGIESRALPRIGRVPVDGPTRWSGGTLFPKSAKKLARALNAASGNRPVVVLANLSGFDGSPESLRKWQLEFGAEIGRAVTNFDGTLIFVVVGRYHGGAYVVFSKALNTGIQALALEGAFASVIGGGPAAAVVFPREVRRRAAKDPEVRALSEQLASAPRNQRPRLRERLDELTARVVLREQGKLAAEFDAIHSVHRAVEVGSLDAVIPPGTLREELVERLRAATSEKASDG